ncbi:hypothetical protein [Nonomuraea basaltis]|uniref:hypothetical protein n=1 Tax=Nonomuraea basaltis TaxID=2495887 RepID=UPI00110C5A8E|nr:hypothetical protein [Nonomuraea basaltis]TMR88857.1 hypothetical protein EJK15_63965 [Nonomuraea basaltis]
MEDGVCLTAEHGGITRGAQRDRGGPAGSHYSITNDQVLGVSPVKGARGEIWFFDDRPNRWGEEAWNLVNANKDIRSAFALHVGPVDGADTPVELGLIGWGRKGQTQWKASEGMFWPGPHEDKVVTLLYDGHHDPAVVADRGAPSQSWRFEEVELPGEFVPTERRGEGDMSQGGDPLKWRARM